jgi:hypothetical protein
MPKDGQTSAISSSTPSERSHSDSLREDKLKAIYEKYREAFERLAKV